LLAQSYPTDWIFKLGRSAKRAVRWMPGVSIA
jgi:hypothetical protein